MNQRIGSGDARWEAVDLNRKISGVVQGKVIIGKNFACWRLLKPGVQMRSPKEKHRRRGLRME